MIEEKQETEIEAFARMIANDFSSLQKNMDERFDEVDQRFDAVDARFDRLEGRMNSMESRMKNVEDVVQDTNDRMDTLVMPVLEDHSRRIKDLELAAA